MFPSRSWLFLPTHREKFVSSACNSEADEVVLDLEDAVPPDSKASARAALMSAARLITERRGRKPWLRTNAVDSEEFALDIKALSGVPLSGFVVPKTETRAHLQALEDFLDEGMRLIILIESALGVEEVYNLASRAPNLAGIMFGHEDYLADIGHWTELQTDATTYARARVLNAARACDVYAVDTPFVAIDNDEGLVKVAQGSADIGFDGMITLHPRQVDAINRAYSPTETQLDVARRLVGMSDANGGAVAYADGVFVAPPLVKRARKMIERFSTHPLD